MSLQRTDGLSASAQLHQRAEQKQMETENTLLKVALTESSEKCEKSLKECVALLQMTEKNREKESVEQRRIVEEIEMSVKQLKNVNEQLQNSIGNALKGLTDDIRRETIRTVGDALRVNIEAINNTSIILKRKSEKMVDVMNSKISELDEAKEKFFSFKGIKTYLFWGGMISNILTLLILLCNTFG